MPLQLSPLEISEELMERLLRLEKEKSPRQGSGPELGQTDGDSSSAPIQDQRAEG